MDSGSTVTRYYTRKDKLPKSQKAINDAEGIFSELPESLITRILSCLSTKDAVRTSLLSKNWRYRWTCITKLDLNDGVLYSRNKKKTTGAAKRCCFVNFVYRTLLLTNPSIESFSLVIADNKYDASLVNTWISSVLNRRVKILRIESHLELSFSALTSHLLFNFNSSCLEELMLEMHLSTIPVPTTTSLYFGSLKFLKLSGITFTLDSSSSSSSYYSENRELCFPVLKKFKIINCTWLIAKRITIIAPLLEKVFIVYNREPLSSEKDKCATKFYFSASSCLKEINVYGCTYISQDIVLLDPSSALNASAKIILYKCKDRVEDTGNRAVLLLKQISQVKYLNFEPWEVLAQSIVVDLPSFSMLSHLELGLVTCEVLLGFLLRSPVLKTLVLKRTLSKFDQELLNSAVVPHCFLSTLQMVKFASVQGNEHELCLAKFVMENCLVLERISFNLRNFRSNLKVVESFKEKLFSFKKGSKNLHVAVFSI